MITSAINPTAGGGQIAGPPGLSNYDLWILAGNSGSLQQYLASTVGPMGPPGANSTVPGPAGPTGVTGPAAWLTPPLPWSTGVGYASNPPAATVIVNGSMYVCAAQHVSTSFAADLAAGKWTLAAQAGTNGTNGVQPWQTPPVAWAASTAYTATLPASTVTYNGGSYVCSTSHTSGASFDASKWTQLAAAGAVVGGAPPSGQCRLIASSTSVCTLIPYNGNQIQVNGALRTIPRASDANPFTLSNTGLTAGTTYHVYLPPTGTALEASTTGHVTGADGTEQKSGDPTRAYVGMVYMDAGTPGLFADGLVKRYVASWFNRRERDLLGSTVSGSTGTTNAEVNSSGRIYFLTFADEAVQVGALGSGSATTNDNLYFLIGIDGLTGSPTSAFVSSSSGQAAPITPRYDVSLTEGLHYATLVGRSGGSTFNANFTINGKTRI